MIQFVIDGLISMLDFAEEKLLFLNVILNSSPAEFVESLLSITYFTIKHVASALLSPILFAIEGFLTGIELALETVIFTINTTVNAIAYNPIGIITNLVSDFIERVRESAEEVKKPIISIKETTENLITGIREARNNLPEVLEYLESYIDVALFTPGKFSDVKLYNMSSVAILSEMEMLFNDIVLQLSSQRARAIEATVESSKSVLLNIKILRSNIEKGAI